MVINFPPSRIHNYISYTYQILNLGVMRLRIDMATISGYQFLPSRIHSYISYTYQILNLGILRLRIDMAMISGDQFSAITYSQLHQLYLSTSQPWSHEVEN